jgi:hypothetical protein
MVFKGICIPYCFEELIGAPGRIKLCIWDARGLVGNFDFTYCVENAEL